MKRTNALIVKMAALALAGGIYGTASAAIVDGVTMGAADFVKEFNKYGGVSVALEEFFDNSIAGWKVLVPQEDAPYRIQSMIFNHHNSVYDWNGAYRYGNGFVTTGSYSGQYENLFITLKMAPTITFSMCNNTTLCQATARLNYNERTGTTQTDYGPAGNSTLTVGAAYMYAQYVLGPDYGNPINWTYAPAFAELTYADGNSNRGQWFPDMDFLLAVNDDKDYWLAAYDPDKEYTEIGDYSVFVMNMYSPDNTSMGNLLFLAKMNPNKKDPDNNDPDNPVPEPETYTMMLAGIGLMGAVVRRRRGMGRS